jgi:hypothetical protein
MYKVNAFWEKLCQLLGLWYSPGTMVSSTNKTDHHDLTQILLIVALNTLTLKGVSGNTDIFSLGLICSCEFKYN